MDNSDNVLKPSPDPRDVRLAELESQLRQRDALIERLQRRLAELEERLAELERAAQRQATPFARKQRKESPKRPGRKAGQGRFTSRSRPAPDQVIGYAVALFDMLPTHVGIQTWGACFCIIARGLVFCIGKTYTSDGHWGIAN